jgi:hypothetical protein
MTDVPEFDTSALILAVDDCALDYAGQEPCCSVVMTDTVEREAQAMCERAYWRGRGDGLDAVLGMIGPRGIDATSLRAMLAEARRRADGVRADSGL